MNNQYNENEDSLIYFDNYGIYGDFVRNGIITIQSSSIDKYTWAQHFKYVTNIMRDGIETERVQNGWIQVDFGNIVVDLSIFDYWFNLIMWKLFCDIGQPIRPKNIFWDEAITRSKIKEYIDYQFLDQNRSIYENMYLNNVIDDCLYNFGTINEFAYFLANTINLEDFCNLMNKYPEAYDIMHLDVSSIPIDLMNKKTMEATRRLADIIKEDGDHCLANFIRAGEGMSIKQFREYAVNIGPKPDGKGGIYPLVINHSFLLGGVNTPTYYLIESAVGRIAQMIVKGNVGDSGYFARLLGLNNMDTIIHPIRNYDCHTKNFQVFTIENEEILRRYENRYYRMTRNGIERKITKNDKHLIGKTILLRSPMTCASHAHGHGICYKCYGDLAYTNSDINAGRLASEEVSSKLTQRMLSAKHLLESVIKAMKWTPGFKDIFQVEYNIIKLQDNFNANGWKLLIDNELISIESEDEDNESFLESVDQFQVLSPKGEVIDIYTSDADSMYITQPLNELIRYAGEADDSGKIVIDLAQLEGEPIFAIEIRNNELTKTLEKIKGLINKNSEVKKRDRHQILQDLIKVMIDGGLNVQGVHAEVILSNQLRSKDDELEKPDWDYPDEEYELVTLNQALTKNPSITVSLSYEKISRMLYNPLTYKKNGASFMDLFFCKQPQLYLSKNIDIVKNDGPKEGMTRAITFGKKGE